jgi:hypothetical protein
MNTEISRSEAIVNCLAIAVLLAGFATGVFARPNHTGPHSSELRGTHVVLVQARQNSLSVSRSVRERV